MWARGPESLSVGGRDVAGSDAACATLAQWPARPGLNTHVLTEIEQQDWAEPEVGDIVVQGPQVRVEA